MLRNVRDITTENPTGEIWKYLRFFFNIDKTAKTLAEIHNIPEGKHKENLQKQAKQIAYCIRQAEEYFRAAIDVGIATKPLLLYYGCVSLGRALILLKKDGRYSLDGLRRNGKHRHHGLDIFEGKIEKASKAKNVNEFFSAIQCSVHLKEDGTPWGHFPLFYDSLIPTTFVINWLTQDVDRPTGLSQSIAHVSNDLIPIDHLKASPLNALDTLKSLPDLYWSLTELGIEPDLSRGTLIRQTLSHYNQTTTTGADGQTTTERKLAMLEDTSDFLIDGLTQTRKQQLLAFLTSKNNKIQVVAEFQSNLHLRLSVASTAPDKVEKQYYPDVIEDISGKKFYILQPGTYVHEGAGLLLLMFCLGMLSRYYPDVWMAMIDKNVEVAELTTKVLGVVIRKFPNLILDQMTEIKHHVHL